MIQKREHILQCSRNSSENERTLLYASADTPKSIMLREMQVIRETIQFDTFHKVKRHKQNKVLLKDTSK